jgi:hypothetical protein
MNCYRITYISYPPAYVFAEDFAGAEEVSENQLTRRRILSIRILGEALLPIPAEEEESEVE